MMPNYSAAAASPVTALVPVVCPGELTDALSRSQESQEIRRILVF